tara:strand:+ start:833 stop:1048 length:216 start_codon:yes stop_codon:yes gene_type:complete
MKLTATQLSNTVTAYTEALTNNLRREDLVQFISSNMLHSLLYLSEEELEERIAQKYDYNLFTTLANKEIVK